MKIKYVGVKEDGETAFGRETGIERWMQGDSHDITNPALAHKMLQHPDVFAPDDAKAKAPAAPAATTAPAPSLPPAPAPTTAPEGEGDAWNITLAPGGAVAAAPGPTAAPAVKPAAKKAAAKSAGKKK